MTPDAKKTTPSTGKSLDVSAAGEQRFAWKKRFRWGLTAGFSILALTPAWIFVAMVAYRSRFPKVLGYPDDGILFTGSIIGMIMAPVMWIVAYYAYQFKPCRYVIWLVDSASIALCLVMFWVVWCKGFRWVS